MSDLIPATGNKLTALPYTEGLNALVARTKAANFYENVCRLGDMVKQNGLQKEPEIIAMITHLKDKATPCGDGTVEFFQAEGDERVIDLFRSFREHRDIRDAWDHVMVGDLLHLLELRDRKKADILSNILYTGIKCDDPKGRSGYISSLAGHLGEDMLELCSASSSYNTRCSHVMWDEALSCSLKDIKKTQSERTSGIQSYSSGEMTGDALIRFEDEIFPKTSDYFGGTSNYRVTPSMARIIVSDIKKGEIVVDESATRERFKSARTLRLAVLNHQLEKYASSRRSLRDLLSHPVTAVKTLLRIE